MADARAAACLAVLMDAADQISETNHRVGQWSVEEHQLYVSGVGRYDKRWSVIASHVGTRTGTQVRSHAQKINKKVAKQTNTETASTAAHGTRRKPRCCGRCRLHGVDVRAEGTRARARPSNAGASRA